MAKGALLTQQGEPGHGIHLLLDGVLSVSVDDREFGELGPGAVVSEHALLENGRGTATLRAVTGCVIAAAALQIDCGALARLGEQHHRESADR
jgi:CRP-like cAMP-binding protein